MRPVQKLLSLMLITLLLLATLAGCWGGDEENTLTVLAGSELRDLEPLFDQIENETGVKLAPKYVGTLDGAELLMAGETTDLAWFSHAKYLSLLQGANARVVAQEKIMLSPVVMGVKESKAQAWGWLNNPAVTWREIVAKAGSGELKFAMSNPAASNSGFTALVGVASAIANTGKALEVGDIDNKALQEFFKGQALTAGSSGWLAENYVKAQADLDGMVNYESVLLALNEGNELTEKLALIYPQEGIITADYPLMLINNEKREQYDKLVTYLRSPEFQEEMMTSTLRRPVIPQVKLSAQFSSQLLVELPFPSNADVIDQLLIAYLDEQRIPAHAIFVIDISGSMEGDRLRDLKQALIGLTGVDTSLTGQFSRFRNREQLTMIPFSDVVYEVRDFSVTETATDSQSMTAIRDYVEGLSIQGGTAIYSSLQTAYQYAEQAKQTNPDRYYSIVLMSDGENNEGISDNEFADFYRSLPADAQSIRTFTILFGDADERAMTELAELTNGRIFNAKSESLAAIFKQIRGYQ